MAARGDEEDGPDEASAGKSCGAMPAPGRGCGPPACTAARLDPPRCLMMMSPSSCGEDWKQPCRFGVACWRPGCHHKHPVVGRAEQVNRLAEFWTRLKSEFEGVRADRSDESVKNVHRHDGGRGASLAAAHSCIAELELQVKETRGQMDVLTARGRDLMASVVGVQEKMNDLVLREGTQAANVAKAINLDLEKKMKAQFDDLSNMCAGFKAESDQSSCAQGQAMVCLSERVETMFEDIAAHGLVRAQFADKVELDRFRLRLEEVERVISSFEVNGKAIEACKVQVESLSLRLESLAGQCSAGSDGERERLLEMLSLFSKVGDNVAQLRQPVCGGREIA